MEKKISLTDYENLQKFSYAVISLNGTLAMLNHHIEVLKRTGDTAAISALQKNLESFVDATIDTYVSKLSVDVEE